MKKASIQNITLHTLAKLTEGQRTSFADENLFVSIDMAKVGTSMLKLSQPYLLSEGRVILITSGSAEVIINLEKLTLKKGTCLITPPQSIFEMEGRSDDFVIKTLSYRELPKSPKYMHLNIIRLSSKDEQLVDVYFQLVWRESQRKKLNLEVIQNLQMALILRLEELNGEQKNTDVSKEKNRRQEIFQAFIALVRQQGTEGRSVDFYAERIFVTPNYLGSVVKEVSGATVKQWIDRNIIVQAKIRLRYSNNSVNEISDELNFANPSFFSKFFRKETGMTPLQYRRNCES